MISTLWNSILQNIEERTQVNVEHEQFCGDNVLAVVQINSNRSICRISRTGVAQTQVWRILHHDGFYPYYLQSVQYPLPRDHAKCVLFCEWLQPQLHILHDNLFRDEVQFTHNGITNTKNSLLGIQGSRGSRMSSSCTDFQLMCGVKY
jgi:hypothetical protein